MGSGEFGMARETGEEINQAMVQGDRDGLGLGAAVGRHLVQMRPPHLEVSLLASAYRLGVPATVHVAVGTDIVHMHPACDPAALGRGSHLDFRLFAAQVAELGGGGVYLNVGSAGLLPEVFLKAVTLARNLAERGTLNTNFYIASSIEALGYPHRDVHLPVHSHRQCTAVRDGGQMNHANLLGEFRVRGNDRGETVG